MQHSPEVEAKEKEIAAATEAIESKLERKGQLAVEIVPAKGRAW